MGPTTLTTHGAACSLSSQKANVRCCIYSSSLLLSLLELWLLYLWTISYSKDTNCNRRMWYNFYILTIYVSADTETTNENVYERYYYINNSSVSACRGLRSDSLEGAVMPKYIWILSDPDPSNDVDACISAYISSAHRGQATVGYSTASCCTA